MSTRRPVNLTSARVPRGKVFVLPERCKGCRFCIDFCPKEVLVESEDSNAKGYRYPLLASGKEDGCIHCQYCTLVCPELAIFTEEDG
ncbi:MAG: 4Fe-4S ferredoxin [Planctomycetes bacterium]|nr:4Fe-4S ferredoxin [Planctomycetota bacterium]